MEVNIAQTRLPGVLTVTSSCFRDHRGFFMETYSSREFETAGFPATVFVQDNLSLSAKGTLRGLHYQLEPHAMGKLVRVVRGAVFDVAVDLRANSPTFGQWVGETLTGDNGKALWVPGGFAHGFLALEDQSLVYYKCDALYAPASERSLHHADPEVGIAWPEPIAVISSKDAAAPGLSNAEYNFAT